MVTLWVGVRGCQQEVAYAHHGQRISRADLLEARQSDEGSLGQLLAAAEPPARLCQLDEVLRVEQCYRACLQHPIEHQAVGSFPILSTNSGLPGR